MYNVSPMDVATVIDKLIEYFNVASHNVQHIQRDLLNYDHSVYVNHSVVLHLTCEVVDKDTVRTMFVFDGTWYTHKWRKMLSSWTPYSGHTNCNDPRAQSPATSDPYSDYDRAMQGI